MRSRREFVKRCCVLGAAAGFNLSRLGSLSSYAQSPGDYKALVCVFLFGGNDGNNTVVPLGGSAYQSYQTMRGQLALPAQSLLAVGGSYGLHPRLTALQSLFNQNKAAIVFNVGTLVQPATRAQVRNGQVPVPRNLYSHSDQVQQWQTTNLVGGGGTGWGGRVNDLLANANATFPAGVSLNGSSALLAGQTTRAINLSPGSEFGIDTFGSTAGKEARFRSLQTILTLDSGVQMIGAANSIFSNALKGAEEINKALESAPALQTPFPNSGLGGQLAQVARVIQVRAALGQNRQIFFCGQGGYDNHSDLLPSQDNLFNGLNAALNAFWNALTELGVNDRVTLFSESEFGRTGNPSTSAGSDHAWGSHHFAIGGAVKGGLYGTFPTLALQGPDDAGNRGHWIPTTSLDQYAATLASWFGVSDADLLNVFPNLVNFPEKKLAFL